MQNEPVAEPSGLDRDVAVDDGLRRRWARLGVTATVIGLLFGPLDLAGQVHTPYPFANLFNSPAIWAAVAFFIGRWATKVVPAIASAVVALVVAVEAYYAADVLFRGANTSNLWSNVAVAWLVLGIGAGFVFGAAGALSNASETRTAALASAILPSVFLAEAAHEATTSRELDWMGLLVVVAVITAWWLLRRAGRTMVTRTLLWIVGWTTLGFIAYLPFG